MKHIFLFIGFQESVFIILIALLLFGPKKIPEVARSLGEGIRQLRNMTDKIKQEIWEAGEKQINDSSKEIKDSFKEVEKEIEENIEGPIKRD